MAEPVFYIRGLPFGIDREWISPAFVEDAKVALELSIEQLSGIAAELETCPGFVDQATVAATASRHVTDEGQRNRLTRLLVGLDKQFRATGRDLPSVLAELGRWLQSEGNLQRSFLSPEQFQELSRRLPVVIKRFAGLDRQAKAERLATATGMPLEDLQIICDLRPIFDKDRTKVEGILPYTILKVVCKGVDGLPIAVETILSAQQLARLAEDSSKAMQKLGALRRIMDEKSLPIPITEVTKTEENPRG